MIALDERELGKRFQQGEEEALNEIFNRYKDPLTGYLYTRKGMSYRDDRADLAETTASDAISKAWELHAEFDPEKGATLTTWIYALAKNLLMDEFRNRRRKSKLIQKRFPNRTGDSYASYYGFDPLSEEDKVCVLRGRKENRILLDPSGLDLSIKRLFGVMVAYNVNPDELNFEGLTPVTGFSLDGLNLDDVKLSPRERKIIILANRFTPKKEIVRRLGISSIATCDTAISRIIAKVRAKV